MRQINRIIVHCSASDLKSQDSIIAIKNLHIASKTQEITWGKYKTTGKGWDDIGYHLVITHDGKPHWGRDLDRPGAHCYGHNEDSIGICLTGEKLFTDAQKGTLMMVIDELCQQFSIPRTEVYGHNEFNEKKTCPNFDLKGLLKSWVISPVLPQATNFLEN